MLVFLVTSLSFSENVWTSTVLGPYVVLIQIKANIKTGFQKMIGSLVKAGEQMTCESVERDNNDVRGGL